MKDATEVTKIEQFKNLIHDVYQYSTNSAVRENVFDKAKSLKILESYDQRWLTSDAASKRIWELFSEITLTDQTFGGLAENTF